MLFQRNEFRNTFICQQTYCDVEPINSLSLPKYLKFEEEFCVIPTWSHLVYLNHSHWRSSHYFVIVNDSSDTHFRSFHYYSIKEQTYKFEFVENTRGNYFTVNVLLIQHDFQIWHTFPSSSSSTSARTLSHWASALIVNEGYWFSPSAWSNLQSDWPWGIFRQQIQWWVCIKFCMPICSFDDIYNTLTLQYGLTSDPSLLSFGCAFKGPLQFQSLRILSEPLTHLRAEVLNGPVLYWIINKRSRSNENDLDVFNNNMKKHSDNCC